MQTERHRPDGAGGTRDHLNNRDHKHKPSREHDNSNYTESTFSFLVGPLQSGHICVALVGSASTTHDNITKAPDRARLKVELVDIRFIEDQRLAQYYFATSYLNLP